MKSFVYEITGISGDEGTCSPWSDMYTEIKDSPGYDELKKQVLGMLKDGRDIVEIGEFWEKSGQKASELFAFLNSIDEKERSFCRKEKHED